MIRTLVLIGALAAPLSPAFAADMRVSLVGKTAQQIDVEIH